MCVRVCGYVYGCVCAHVCMVPVCVCMCACMREAGEAIIDKPCGIHFTQMHVGYD